MPYKPPYGAHVILLFVLTFSTLVLVILSTFSSPFIRSISFLRLPSDAGDTTFGAFGWCSPDFCLPNTVGYEYGNEVNKALTGGMFLWPIAIIFVFFTLIAILPLLFVHESRALRFVGNRIFFLFAVNFATLLVVLAWVYTIYGWSIAHRSFEIAGTAVHLGPAVWMGLAAMLCMLVVYYLAWPSEAWDGKAAQATGGAAARGVPGPPANGYYHYKRTTREIVPR
ncbi:hypothetical protein P7C73_g3554, partial [Tremellales sp. Uapishka_1]